MTPRLFLSNSNCEDDFIIVYLNPRKNIWVDTENTCDGFELTEESWETFKQFIESLFKYKNSFQFKEDDEYLYRIREPLTEEEIEEVVIENARKEEWLKEKKRREQEEDENKNDDDEN